MDLFLLGCFAGVGACLSLHHLNQRRIARYFTKLPGVDPVLIRWPTPDELERTAYQHFLPQRLTPRLQGLDFPRLMRDVEEHLMRRIPGAKLLGFDLHFSLYHPPLLAVCVVNLQGQSVHVASKPTPGQELALFNLFADLHKQIDAIPSTPASDVPKEEA